MKTFNYLVPTNLDLQSLLSKKDYKTNYYKYLFIIDTIIRIPKENRHKTTYDEDNYTFQTYTEVYSQIFKTILGNDYSKLIENLIDLNIVAEDSKYSFGAMGSKSKGYRLFKTYFDAPKRTIRDSDSLTSQRALNYSYSHLSSLNETELRLFEDSKQIHLPFYDDQELLELCEYNQMKYDNMLFDITNINEKKFRIRKSKHGRLYMNVSNLSKKIRKDLMIDNQLLVENDVTACQPTMLGISCVRNTDVKKWLELCQGDKTKGLDIYTYQMNKIGYKGSRDDFKKAWAGVMFGNFGYKSKIMELTEKEFPTIFAKIKELKAGNYSKLAQKLQYLESDYIIQNVCKSLYSKYSDIKLVTVHDSILSTKEYQHIVKEEMQNIFKQMFDFELKLDYICADKNNNLTMEQFNNDNGVQISYNQEILHLEYCVSHSDDITFEADYTKENIENLADKILNFKEVNYGKLQLSDEEVFKCNCSYVKFINDFGTKQFITKHFSLLNKIDMFDLYGDEDELE